MSLNVFLEWAKAIGGNAHKNSAIVDNTVLTYLDLKSEKILESLQKGIGPDPRYIYIYSDEWIQRQSQCKGL